MLCTRLHIKHKHLVRTLGTKGVRPQAARYIRGRGLGARVIHCTPRVTTLITSTRCTPATARKRGERAARGERERRQRAVSSAVACACVCRRARVSLRASRQRYVMKSNLLTAALQSTMYMRVHVQLLVHPPVGPAPRYSIIIKRYNIDSIYSITD